MNQPAPWLLAVALIACKPSSTAPESMPMTSAQADGLRRIPVLDSYLTYREAGSGSPIVLLHGNPTSSFVWRNVLPVVAARGRCLAPDLIGMGHSGKPEGAYRFEDHARYLDAWFSSLDLRDVVVVGYDWGGVLAIDWARRHPARVRGVVVFETFLQQLHWSEYPLQAAVLFRALRTPWVGEKLVLEQNAFLARSLANGVKSGLTDAARVEYYAPFPDPTSRRPMLQWPRELPIDGEPADVVAILDRNAAWLASARTVPKLLLTFDGSGLSNTPVVEWAKRSIPNLDVVPLGAAGHHAPEDAPVPIADAIVGWLDRQSQR
jgi:haloalkane dehalogenase